jgi:hypothetical protein
MAGTCDPYSTDDLEWLLITTAIVLVARYIPPDAAQEFLLTEVAGGHIRYRYSGKLEFDGWAFPEFYFWWRNKFILHEITPGGTVIRTGAALIKARAAPQRRHRQGQHWSHRAGPPDEYGNERYVLDVQQSVTVRMPLVQLHRDDIVRRLRERGFMSASDSTSAQQELPLSAPLSPPPSSEQAKHEEPTSAQQTKPVGPISVQTQKQWLPEEADEWLIADVKSHSLPTKKRALSEWCRKSFDRMKEAFRNDPPYQDAGSLRRLFYKLKKKNRIEPI